MKAPLPVRVARFASGVAIIAAGIWLTVEALTTGLYPDRGHQLLVLAVTTVVICVGLLIQGFISPQASARRRQQRRSPLARTMSGRPTRSYLNN